MHLSFLWTVLLLALLRAQDVSSPSLGVFEAHNDVGTVLHTGTAAFDAATKTYTLSGSGENMWAQADDFQFVWRKVSGDVSLAATVSLVGTEGENHRKAVLMIRQSLDADSPYADAAIHGDGLTSLQFRQTKGAPTHEIEANVSAPKRLRIEKRGDRFYLFVAPQPNGQLAFAGGSAMVALTSPFYVGIGVCAHNKDNVQQATFTDLDLKTGEPSSQATQNYSTIETVTVASTDASVAYVAPVHLESPNWSQDGASILFSEAGKWQQMPVSGGRVQNLEGDAPDEYGQEHSPDGRYVYISSTRSGTAQIWRTAADGSQGEQLTHDDQNNASPHLSPDGQQLVFLSYAGNLNLLAPNTDVSLRVLSLANRTPRTIAKFRGGPASLSMHPWSPDGKRLTFVSYQSVGE